jgi:hypothetical protein
MEYTPSTGWTVEADLDYTNIILTRLKEDSVQDNWKQQKLEFDVAAHAAEWNVPHEEASKRIQEFLFENGFGWFTAINVVQHIDKPFLQVNVNGPNSITQDYERYERAAPATLTATTTYSVSIDVPTIEYVEIGGKKYEKKKLEEALKLIEEA